jgi:8-oxo-dGTP pyrophosphatase MutT (NUDIX family)
VTEPAASEERSERASEERRERGGEAACVESPRYHRDDHLGERTLLVAAAYIVLRRTAAGREEVLLHLRAATGYADGYWAVLAGHVDRDESMHEAAVREAAEESGVTLRIEDLEPVTVLHRFVRGGDEVDQRVDAFFVVRQWTGEPTLREENKASAMRWFPLDALPEPVVPHERLVLDALARGTALPALISLPISGGANVAADRVG